MSDFDNTWVVVANPNAGNGKIADVLSFLKSESKINDISVEFSFLDNPNSIGEKYELGYRQYLIVGGDGTINRIVNIFLNWSKDDFSKLTFALIPFGTGNDFARCLHIPFEAKAAFQFLLNKNRKRVDIGVCEFLSSQKRMQTRYFVNSSGIGFEVNVLLTKEKLISKFGFHGRWIYLLSVMTSLFKTCSRQFIIKDLDSSCDILQKNNYTMSISNGCYSGGGFKQNPDALPDDGLLDVMTMERLSFFEAIKCLWLLLKSRLSDCKKVLNFQTAAFSVVSLDKNPFWLEFDGELFFCCGIARFSLHKFFMNVIIP